MLCSIPRPRDNIGQSSVDLSLNWEQNLLWHVLFVISHFSWSATKRPRSAEEKLGYFSFGLLCSIPRPRDNIGHSSVDLSLNQEQQLQKDILFATWHVCWSTTKYPRSEVKLISHLACKAVFLDPETILDRVLHHSLDPGRGSPRKHYWLVMLMHNDGDFLWEMDHWLQDNLSAHYFHMKTLDLSFLVSLLQGATLLVTLRCPSKIFSPKFFSSMRCWWSKARHNAAKHFRLFPLSEHSQDSWDFWLWAQTEP